MVATVAALPRGLANRSLDTVLFVYVFVSVAYSNSMLVFESEEAAEQLG